ncbi:MAG: hypothetical protein IJ137_02310 [Eubacterium sp.]|nr:hypothetical protein [Eubacterium sp.]
MKQTLKMNRNGDLKAGRYHNDYSPRYQEPYDIYEKARRHMKQMKKEDKKANEGSPLT